MKAIFDQLAADCSKLTTRRYSTSFSLGIRLLDRQLHAPIYAIYGFVRLADEIVDSFSGYDQQGLLLKLKNDCFQALEEGISTNPILHAFQQVVHRFGIDRSLVLQFLHSMEMDLLPQDYDQDKYETYILGSAEVVGLMCLSVFTGGDQQRYQALKPQAMRLGAAFQKVNFLRDIGADYRQLNRSYFPDVDLSRFSDQDKAAIEEDIDADFTAALAGIRELPQSSRRGVYLAYQYYYRLFRKIRMARACNVFSQRFRISNRRKLLLLCDTFLRYQLNWI